MLELAHRNVKSLVYKADIYKGQEEDKWQVLKIISVTDSLSTILQLLGEELEEASWLI